MPRCAAFKPNGEQCERIVGASQRHCYSHDPERKVERSRNASRAARSKPSREIVAVKEQLQEIADRVLLGDLDRADAAVVSQILNVKLRALETERRIRETEEFEARLQELEREIAPRHRTVGYA